MDVHQYMEAEVETGVPQDLSMSPILFAIYLSGVFKKVEKEIEGCIATSFADDCG